MYTSQEASSTASSAGPQPATDRSSTGWATRTLNIWAVLVAASWRHVGYVMVLYLAGLKSVDPTLREAAADRRREPAPDVLPGRLPGHAADQRRDHRRDRHRVAARVRHRLHHQPRQERPRAALDADHEQQRSARRASIGFGSAIAVVLLVDLAGADRDLPRPGRCGRTGDDAPPACEPPARARPSSKRRRIRWQRGSALHAFLITMCARSGCSRWPGPSTRPSGRYGDTSAQRLCLVADDRSRLDNFIYAWNEARAAALLPQHAASWSSPAVILDAVRLLDARLRLLALQLQVQPRCC